MFANAARLLLRLAGWLLTPLVIVLAAAIGAGAGLVVAPRFPVTVALVVTAALGFAAGTVGLLFWIRLLRRSPELQEVLAVTPEGVPRPEAVEELIHHGESTHHGEKP
jgi:hypothetical protein